LVKERSEAACGQPGQELKVRLERLCPYLYLGVPLVWKAQHHVWRKEKAEVRIVVMRDLLSDLKSIRTCSNDQGSMTMKGERYSSRIATT
jgi:hypothetical protein